MVEAAATIWTYGQKLVANEEVHLTSDLSTPVCCRLVFFYKSWRRGHKLSNVGDGAAGLTLKPVHRLPVRL